MASRSHTRRPTILIVDEEWSARALESILSPAGYHVMRAYTAVSGLDRARTQPPDLIFINISLPDGSGIELCTTLRGDNRIGASVPIVVTSTLRPLREERLAALKAGAWEVLSHPLDAQELLLKLNAYTQAKSEIDRIRQGALLDQLTGFYTLRGLEQRADELQSLAHRQHEALACVVLAPQPAAKEDQEAIAAAVMRLARVLKDAGRVSDAIGMLGQTEFAIFAPSTDERGAAKMAARLGAVVQSTLAEEEAPFHVKAGYDAVPNVWETPGMAQQLLPHATIALRRAMSASNGEWIQAFEPRTMPS